MTLLSLVSAWKHLTDIKLHLWPKKVFPHICQINSYYPLINGGYTLLSHYSAVK
jgi:hypothetical protein